MRTAHADPPRGGGHGTDGRRLLHAPPVAPVDLVAACYSAALLSIPICDAGLDAGEGLVELDGHVGRVRSIGPALGSLPAIAML